MLDFRGPASPAIGDALNAGYGYLEVCCLGCKTHQTVALDIIRRPKTTPVHELERYMRCKTDEGEQSGDVEKKASGTGFVKGRPLRYLGQLKRENLFHSWSSFFRLTAK